MRTFRPNSVNLESINLPVSINFNHFFSSVQVLGRKPLACLYQDVFLQIYFSSKRRGVSIHGPDVINLFEKDDISHTGLVTL